MLVGGDVPAETSRQTQSLGLGEKRFVTPQLQLRRLALGQIQYEGDAFGWLPVEERRAYQDRNAAPVLLHVLCFERSCASGREQFVHAVVVILVPFGRHQILPADQ